MRALPMLLLLAACRQATIPAADSDTDTAVPEDTEPDTDTDPGADTDTSPDTDTDVDTGPPPPGYHVRFVALGDGGTGSTGQYAVAEKMLEVCARFDRGCDFAVYLGDNIYDSGVDAVDDPQFETKFELPYQNITFPFWVALGNHDYGGGGAGYEIWKADYQIAYSDHSAKWNMPDRYYQVPPTSVGAPEVGLWALDTNAILFGFGSDQKTWLDAELAASGATWRIAFGHHPYISNGRHGDAGAYEGIADWVPLAEVPRGDYVKQFMDDAICGKVDLYLSGHDHNRQWLGERCGTHFVVSGGAAKTTDFRHDGNSTLFQDDRTPGFAWIEILDDTLTGYFYDKDGNEAGPFVITR